MHLKLAKFKAAAYPFLSITSSDGKMLTNQASRNLQHQQCLATRPLTQRRISTGNAPFGTQLPQYALYKRPSVSCQASGGWLDNLLRSVSTDGSNTPEYGSDTDTDTTPVVTAKSKKLRDYAEVAYLTGRARQVAQHFPTVLGIDDFLYRIEIALYAYGFYGDNSIAMVNLCRDEITVTLKQKLDSVFGMAFNTNGLGGVLTCGVTGVSAGLSHAPVSQGSGKERYVFFSFPHISIDSTGEVGTISRPGRPGASCACGALNKAFIDIKRDGISTNCKMPGVHEPLDPEFTILKQRLARRLRYEGVKTADMENWTLVDLTTVAERTITDDLEYLISQTVDPKKADYAVVTGVQIHNWGERFDDDSPNLEFIAPENVYVVVNGEKTFLDLNAMPALTPRQIRLLSDKNMGTSPSSSGGDVVCNNAGSSTLREIDPPYLYNSREMRRRKSEQAASYLDLINKERLEPETTCAWPSWQSGLRIPESRGKVNGGNSALHFDKNYTSVDNKSPEEWAAMQSQYAATEPPPGNGSQSDDGSVVEASVVVGGSKDNGGGR